MELRTQLVAAGGNGFGLFSPLPRSSDFAADCHRLQPRGSIKAPSSVVRVAAWRRRVKRDHAVRAALLAREGAESSRSVLRWVLPSGSESSPARRRGKTCSV